MLGTKAQLSKTQTCLVKRNAACLEQEKTHTLHEYISITALQCDQQTSSCRSEMTLFKSSTLS